MNERKASWVVRLVSAIDWPLVLIVSTLASVGVFNLYSASIAAGKAYHIAQAIAYLFGLGVALVMGLINRRVYERWSYVVYGCVVALLFW